MGFEISMGDVPEGYGGDLDAGNYTIQLSGAPELTETKGEGGKAKLPMLNARWEVLEGKLKGKEVTLRYVLGMEMVDGKPKFTPGVVNFKRDIKNLTGEDMPEGFKLNERNAVKFYGTKAKGKLGNLNVRKYKAKGWKEGEDLGTAYWITGPATMGQNAGGGSSAAAAAPAGTVAAEVEPEDDFT